MNDLKKHINSVAVNSGISTVGKLDFIVLNLRRYVIDLLPKPFRALLSRYRALSSQKRVEKRLKKIRANGKTIVHFLHIGKTAGTAIHHAIKGCSSDDSYHIELRGHGFLLRDLPIGDKAVFILRDPVSRFVSAFNSTRTEGLPRYYYPLGPREKAAFKKFPSANLLARSLSSKDIKTKRKAELAMNCIRHVNTSYWDWLLNQEYLERRFSDILFVGFQETLTSDFEQLKKIIGLNEEIQLPQDPVSAYRAPKNTEKLDGLAIENIKKWYSSDYECIDFINEKYISKQSKL